MMLPRQGHRALATLTRFRLRRGQPPDTPGIPCTTAQLTALALTAAKPDHPELVDTDDP